MNVCPVVKISAAKEEKSGVKPNQINMKMNWVKPQPNLAGIIDQWADFTTAEEKRICLLYRVGLVKSLPDWLAMYMQRSIDDCLCVIGEYYS